jgi:hypothetical protein
MSELPTPVSSKWLAAARWCLRATVALQCLGAAKFALGAGGQVFELLWDAPDVGGFGLSEATSLAVAHTAGWLLIVAAGLTLLRPCWPVLLPVALWQLLLAGAHTWLGGGFWAEVSLPAHATRILAPLALAIVDPWPARAPLSPARWEAGVWLLRGAAALTFVAHGLEAWNLNPVFLDYLIIAAERLLDFDLSQDAAETILRAIAAVDIAAALLLVARRWRAVAYYMAAWGAITALSRIVHGGLAAYPQTLIRAANAGVPLAVGLYWSFRRGRRM